MSFLGEGSGVANGLGRSESEEASSWAAVTGSRLPAEIVLGAETYLLSLFFGKVILRGRSYNVSSSFSFSSPFSEFMVLN